MNKERAVFEPWLESFLRPRYPELEAPLMAAVDAFDEIQDSRQLTAELLRPIVEAASSSRTPLRENATPFMARLSADWGQVREAILKMSRSTKAHVRFNAILCLAPSTPHELIDHVLRTGLVDKSARVRGKAADKTGTLRDTRLIPELTTALAVETDEKARGVMDFELRLLRDGYILAPAVTRGYYNLTVHTVDGACSSTWISEEDLRTKGIDALAAERRNRK